jgi:hypothetical protein
MKRLWTTCYGRAKQLPENLVQVQTSRSAPQWWQAKMKAMVWEFAPIDKIFAMAKTKIGDWRLAYRNQIEALDGKGRLKEIIDELPEGAVLLCWEGDHCECHRKVLAEIITEKGYAEVSEFILPPSEHESKRRTPKRSRKVLV